MKIVAMDECSMIPPYGAAGSIEHEIREADGWLLAKLASNRGKVGVVGALNSTIQLDRQKGFIDKIKSKGMTAERSSTARSPDLADLRR